MLIGPGQTLLDIGCGVGGPLRAIARFTGAKCIGINNNAYQIKRATKHVADAGLTSLCSFKKCNFMALDFEDNSVDGAYAIEATCHAPDKAACFREILRVLKPGAIFTGYDWCMTDLFDAKNPVHVAIKTVFFRCPTSHPMLLGFSGHILNDIVLYEMKGHRGGRWFA